MDLYAATRVYTGRGLRRVVSGNHPGPMLVYTATRGQPRVPEQPSEWWASCTPRVILAQWKSVAYPQKLGTWKQVTVRRLISRGATEGKHVNWTELQIVPDGSGIYRGTQDVEPHGTWNCNRGSVEALTTLHA
ncbi:uncharacterized protein LOC111863799 isoform X9 [Cryptotermes secundus]|uniref:uncharacterized protein LOC111863799 isoform X9 n=1 Tax=Cryptotermes secundus TaxID=105785 RepID=UPI001454CA34|nr:uncharacterized protein LOC111863799 isoform X9 [Cryptotermes secundus]